MPSLTEFTDQELLLRIANGDQAAFEYLFDSWYIRLVVFSESFTVSKEEAEELVSDAFLKFWAARTRFDAINKIKSYLYTITRNSSYNVLRARRNQPAAFIEEISDEEQLVAEVEAVKSEIIAAVFREIEKLPLKCQQVMRLTYEEGLNSQQISERLGITVSTVTSHRARAIQLLKISLKEYYPLHITLYILKTIF